MSDWLIALLYFVYAYLQALAVVRLIDREDRQPGWTVLACLVAAPAVSLVAVAGAFVFVHNYLLRRKP